MPPRSNGKQPSASSIGKRKADDALTSTQTMRRRKDTASTASQPPSQQSSAPSVSQPSKPRRATVQTEEEEEADVEFIDVDKDGSTSEAVPTDEGTEPGPIKEDEEAELGQ